ncbi:ABC transporter ATP-binding protein [Candidatus Gottesmanbacteria bacterium]|nr:ABC transporter ATP-binding protein [Candidatus Gottesmanbacteria bacterium]
MIAILNVSKIYKLDGVEVRAVNKINLTIKEKEFIAIMGPSGSGKSTLMHLIGALDTPTSGSVMIDGKDIGKMNDEELAFLRNQTIGFVFQQFNLLPKTTSIDNVILPLLYGSTPSSLRKSLAQQMLVKVDLSNRLCHLPSQLSGGQQQRVAIARAMVTNPKIILADEPTGNLDSKSSVEIMKLFKQLNKEGKTIILITHELTIAKFAKRIVHIKDGEIIKNNNDYR